MIYAVAAGEDVDYLAVAAELHKTAEEIDSPRFIGSMRSRAIATHLPNERIRGDALHAIDRLVVLLAPAK